MQSYRIYISSPTDVDDERRLAQKVIEQELPKDPLLWCKIGCQAVSWGDPYHQAPMPATMTPQEAVNRSQGRPSECDVVIVILWARLGKLLDGMTRPDGTPYLSGTEYEYEDAMNAKRRPHILVYRRTTEPPIAWSEPEKRVQQLEQFNRVEAFFGRFHNPDGSAKGGYTEYGSPEEFGQRLRNDLKAFFNDRITTPPPPPRLPPDTPPYSAIIKALQDGKVVPVIGPGASSIGRPPQEVWNPEAHAFLPSGVELSHLLAIEGHFPATDACDDLAEVASYYAEFQSRESLRERLRRLLSDLSPDIAIPPLYHLLVEISKKKPMLIITTNFDTEIEQAFRAASCDYDLVVYPADRKDEENTLLWWQHGEQQPVSPAPTPNELLIDLDKTTVIFKMYGSCSENDAWNGYVITENDYARFFSRLYAESAIPKQFAARFRDHSLLFIGYGLRDWSLRVVTSRLSGMINPRRNAEDTAGRDYWAIVDQLTPQEKDLWHKWGVFPYRVDLDHFVDQLRERIQP
jgi:hypothetical protein